VHMRVNGGEAVRRLNLCVFLLNCAKGNDLQKVQIDTNIHIIPHASSNRSRLLRFSTSTRPPLPLLVNPPGRYMHVWDSRPCGF